jgi:hypothetical protein
MVQRMGYRAFSTIAHNLSTAFSGVIHRKLWIEAGFPEYTVSEPLIKNYLLASFNKRPSIATKPRLISPIPK